MFTTHFKMTSHPFPSYLPAEALQRDTRFLEALARLQFFLDYELSAMITGEEGVGKSSLIRLFISTLAANRLPHVYLHLTQLQATAFLKIFVHALGEKPAPNKDQVLMQITTKLAAVDQTTICIIDEAHLLDSHALVDLRLLLSNAMEATPRLKLLLVGHSQLKKDLNRSCHAALAQRTTIRYHIPPFTLQQTIDYLDFHLQRVAAPTKLFDQDVKQQIHEHSRGIPRLINNLATATLITAATLNSQRITNQCFSHTLADFQLYS